MCYFRYVWQDTVRSNRPVWLFSTVGLHAAVESNISATWQRPIRLYQWDGATTRYLCLSCRFWIIWGILSKNIVSLTFPSLLLSPCSDGLQPQPSVFRDSGAALHSARHATRHTAGPLHPGVYAAPEHDAGVQGERHSHDGQHPRQLRGFSLWCYHQAHVSSIPMMAVFSLLNLQCFANSYPHATMYTS